MSTYNRSVVAVTNRSLCTRPFLEQVERVCAFQPAALILREKDLDESAYEALAATSWRSANATKFPVSFTASSMWQSVSV